jgi:hypothetical protein
MPNSDSEDDELAEDLDPEEEDDDTLEGNLATYLGLLETAGEDDEYQSIMYDKDSTTSQKRAKSTVHHFSGENSFSSEYEDDDYDDNGSACESHLESIKELDDYDDECYDDDDYDDNNSIETSAKATSSPEGDSVSDSSKFSSSMARRVSAGDRTNAIMSEAQSTIQDSLEADDEIDKIRHARERESYAHKTAGDSKASPKINGKLNRILGDQIERLKKIQLLYKESAADKMLNDQRALIGEMSNDVDERENIWDIMCGGGEEQYSDEENSKNAAGKAPQKNDSCHEVERRQCKSNAVDNKYGVLQNNDEDGYYVDVRRGKQEKKKALSRNSSGVVDSAQGGSGSVPSNKFDVEERHRAKLSDIVAKRKQEDDEAQSLQEKANAKRKKFKDALLEKAMRTRALPGESSDRTFEEIGEIGLRKNLAGLKASSMRARNPSVLTLHEIEEQKKAEDDRVEQIAAIRRKFKEQHKNILLTLKQKHKEEEKKLELKTLAEEEKTRKRKLRGQHILAKRAESLLQQVDPLGTGLGGMEDNIPVSSTPSLSRRGSGIAVGSGLAGVRAHRAQSAENTAQHRYRVNCSGAHYGLRIYFRDVDGLSKADWTGVLWSAVLWYCIVTATVQCSSVQCSAEQYTVVNAQLLSGYFSLFIAQLEDMKNVLSCCFQSSNIYISQCIPSHSMASHSTYRS